MSDTAVIGRIEAPVAHEPTFYAILKLIPTQGAMITTDIDWKVHFETDKQE